MDAEARSPIFFCFSGPGGGGKSTVCRRLLGLDSSLRLSISTTSRQPRAEEVDEVHYFFVTREEFEDRLSAGCFLEHTEFGGNYYGTEKRNIELALSEHRDLLLDIEVEGVAQMKRLYGPQVVTTFVMPPSFAVLRQRLEQRGSDSEERIAQRLREAEREFAVLSNPAFSDYLLINDSLEECVKRAHSIISSERCRLSRCIEQSMQRLLRV